MLPLCRFPYTLMSKVAKERGIHLHCRRSQEKWIRWKSLSMRDATESADLALSRQLALSSAGRRHRRKEHSTIPLPWNSSSSKSSTIFSSSSSMRNAHDITPTRSISSLHSSMRSSRFRSPSLRRDSFSKLEPPSGAKLLDLFPHTRMRMSQAGFQAPQYYGRLTAGILRQELLNVIFQWTHDIESLVRDERKFSLSSRV